MQTKTRAIRISDEIWDELEQRATEHKLRGRAEYISYILDNPVVTTQEIERVVEHVMEVPDPQTLRELETANARIAQLQDELQVAKTLPTTTAPIMEKKPVHRFSFASIQKRWPETQRNRYNKLGWKPDEWMKIVLETVYDMLDELE